MVELLTRAFGFDILGVKPDLLADFVMLFDVAAIVILGLHILCIDNMVDGGGVFW